MGSRTPALSPRVLRKDNSTCHQIHKGSVLGHLRNRKGTGSGRTGERPENVRTGSRSATTWLPRGQQNYSPVVRTHLPPNVPTRKRTIPVARRERKTPRRRDLERKGNVSLVTVLPPIWMSSTGWVRIPSVTLRVRRRIENSDDVKGVLRDRRDR